VRPSVDRWYAIGVSLLPEVPDRERWPAVHALPLAAWRPALRELAARLHVPDGWERLSGGEDSAVFATGPHVVKLVPPCYAADAQREIAVLPRLHLPVPSPQLLGVAELDGWTALHLARLPGVPADRVWASLAPAVRLDVARDLGALLAALHRTPTEPDDGDASALMARLRARARRHEDAGFPEVAGFLDRHLPAGGPATLVHFDLNTGNVMLDERGRLAGVLDFVASRAFHPAFDLVTPGVFFARGDPALLGALVSTSGIAAGPEELAAWHLLHPFSDLRRDLGMAGRAPDVPLAEGVIDLWRR
jgi:hygromycin-B 7''-O-kinase